MILLAGMTVANIQRGLTSQIYLYGEEHSQQRILDEELEIWGGYYARGMRDLFVEFPYFDAQFLNLWMKADDDELLTFQEVIELFSYVYWQEACCFVTGELCSSQGFMLMSSFTA